MKMFAKRAVSMCQNTGDISTSELTSVLCDGVSETAKHELVALVAQSPPASTDSSAISKLG
eukprot:6243232-Pyramimonas_sp.AAC.1